MGLIMVHCALLFKVVMVCRNNISDMSAVMQKLCIILFTCAKCFFFFGKETAIWQTTEEFTLAELVQ
jgi:hypothetical protein